jgi:hypothetical protein
MRFKCILTKHHSAHVRYIDCWCEGVELKAQLAYTKKVEFKKEREVGPSRLLSGKVYPSLHKEWLGDDHLFEYATFLHYHGGSVRRRERRGDGDIWILLY